MDKYTVLKKKDEAGKDTEEDLQLGLGATGVVVKVIRKSDGSTWAIKKIELEDGVNISQHMLREGCIMGDIFHPNIVRLEETFIHEGYLCFVLEFVDMTLGEHMERYAHEYPRLIKPFMGNILSAVVHFHSRGIIHRDLKMSNLLVAALDKDFVLKIVDFGLARGVVGSHGRLTPELGTVSFMAPEVLLGSINYNTAVDMWSVGVVFAEMLLGGISLFFGHNEGQVLEEIFNTMGVPNEDSWPRASELLGWKQLVEPLLIQNPDFPPYPRKEFSESFPNLEPCGLDLLLKMLLFDPEKRISAQEALAHPYMKGWEKPRERLR